MGVCTKERKGVAAEVLMATPSHVHMMMMMIITITAAHDERRVGFERKVGFIEITAMRHRRGG